MTSINRMAIGRSGAFLVLTAILMVIWPVSAPAGGINLGDLDWSVQYMIDQSQTVLDKNQWTDPRNNRGLAISPDGRYLYSGYNNGPEVRKIDLTVADYTDATVVRTTALRGKAIAVDDAGRVYFAEGSSIKIYDAGLSTLQQTITTTNCEGVAVHRESGQLVLYSSDRNTGKLSKWLVSESGGVVTGATKDAAFGLSGDVTLTANLRGVEVDSSGRIWAAGYGTNSVYVVAANGLSYSTIGGVTTPIDIGFDNGRAMVTQYTARQISVFDTEGLSLVSTVTVPWASLELDPDGQSGGGGLSGISVLPGVGFYVTNETGQTANEKSTYGRSDSYSGWVDGNYYTDANHDDNDPILYAASVNLLHPGDVNGDNKVDLGDLGILAGHWSNTSGTMTWQTGDLSGDGKVDLGDLGILAGNWGWVQADPPPGGANIPEPATLSLLVLGGLAIVRRRRNSA